MTLPKVTKTREGYYTAEIGSNRTAKYTNPVSALRVLCEMLADELEAAEKQRYPWHPTGPCECGGWGTPTGCPGCNIRCMGG
jgi:hypothetical protein